MLLNTDGDYYETFHSRSGSICLGSKQWVKDKAQEALNQQDANVLNDMIEEMRVNLRSVNLKDYYAPLDFIDEPIYDFIKTKECGTRRN